MAERKRLGDLLVEGKVISPMQLQSGLAHQKQWGGRLGTALIEKGFVTDDVLAKFLSFQLNVPSVNLSKVQVANDVLDRIPRELREKHFCAPIAVMKEGSRETVIVAMADPTDLRVVDEIGFATGLKVKPVIATELALKRFLFGEGAGMKNFRDRGPAAAEGTEDFEMDVVQGSVDGVPVNAGPGPGPGSMQRARSGLGTGLAPGSTAPIGESTIDLEPEELELSPVTFVPMAPARAPSPVQTPVPAPATSTSDPFLAAVRANASGAPMATPARTPVVVGTVSGMASDSLTPEPAPLAGGSILGALDGLVAPPGLGAGDEDDRTEPEIEIPAMPVPPPAPAPCPPTAAPAPAPWTAPAEILMQDAWGEAVVATGVMPAEDSVPEISLPGPEYLTPMPETAAAAQAEPEFGFDVPPELELAEGTSGFFATTAPSTFPPEPEPESFEPAAESFQPEPESFEPAAAEAAPEYAPAPEPEHEPTVADSFPVETWAPSDGPLAEVPAPATAAPYPEDAATAEGHWPPPEPAVPPPYIPAASAPPPSSSAGAVPVMTMLGADESDPADMERTQLGQGAFEPTWTGADELSTPPSAPWTPPAAMASMPSAPAPRPDPVTLEPSRETRTPEPSRTRESPLPPPVPAPAAKPIAVTAAAVPDEQVALNATIAKKLKLLNAIAELLLEKGLITEEEIKEKISRKK